MWGGVESGDVQVVRDALQASADPNSGYPRPGSQSVWEWLQSLFGAGRSPTRLSALGTANSYTALYSALAGRGDPAAPQHRKRLRQYEDVAALLQKAGARP
jgi:hypothetical protein